jgi:glutathionylspermidine synthase
VPNTPSLQVASGAANNLATANKPTFLEPLILIVLAILALLAVIWRRFKTKRRLQ